MRPLFLQKLSGGPDPQANSVIHMGVARSELLTIAVRNLAIPWRVCSTVQAYGCTAATSKFCLAPATP